MGLTSYIGDRIYEEIEKKFVEYLNRKKLQKILINSCKDAKVEVTDEFEKAIMEIDSEKIKPNLTINKISENLDNIFEDHNVDKRKKEFIIKKYKEKSYKDVLELYHIQESLDVINEGVNVIDKKISKQEETIGEIDKCVKGISEDVCSEIKNRRKTEIFFIDELNYSKYYFYFELELLESFEGLVEIIDDIFEKLEFDTLIGAIFKYESDYLFNKIFVEFYNPVQQIFFRDYLKEMDSIFSENEIRIFNIYVPF